MKKIFNYLSTMLAALILTVTLSIGVVSVTAADENNVIETSFIVQNQEAEAAVVALPAPSPEDSLKVCKDESGASKMCDDKDLLAALILSIGGFKGMSALAIAFLVSKLLLFLILSPFFSNMFPSLNKGNIKLLIAVGLNLAVGILALMVPPTSLSFVAAITHSSVMVLASVFANQAYKQFFTKKGEA